MLFCRGDKHGEVWFVIDLFLGVYRLRFVITNLIVHYLTITEAKWFCRIDILGS